MYLGGGAAGPGGEVHAGRPPPVGGLGRHPSPELHHRVRLRGLRHPEAERVQEVEGRPEGQGSQPIAMVA